MTILCFIFYFALTLSFTSSLTPFEKSECGKSKSCLRWFSCDMSSCDFEFSWNEKEYNSTRYLQIELIGKLTSTNAYLALGFSSTNKMSDNAVVACHIENGTVGISAAYNAYHRNIMLKNDEIDSNYFVKFKDDLYGVGYDSQTNILWCRFLRLIQPTMNLEKLKDLSEKEYFLLSAKSDFQDGKIKYHMMNKRPSSFSYNLTSSNWVNSLINNYIFIKLHACLMIFGWIFCATNGIIIANFYKNYWSQTTLFSKEIWFQLHRIIQFICILCVCSGFILIFIHVGGFSTLGSLPNSAHPIMGIVATGFMLANPIMALFRCSPNHPSRWIFNRLHLLVGVTAYVLALSTAIIGIQLPPAGPNLSNLSYPYILVAVYLGLIIILFLYGEVRKCLADKSRVLSETEIKVNSSLIKEINDNYRSGYHILVLSLVLSFGFGIAFIGIIISN